MSPATPDGNLPQTLDGQTGSFHVLATLVSGIKNTLGPHCFWCSSKCIWRLLGSFNLPLCLLEKDLDFLVGGGKEGQRVRQTGTGFVVSSREGGFGSSLEQSRKS